MENPGIKYTVTACEAKLKEFSYIPYHCPDPNCNKYIMHTHYLRHILCDHHINPKMISLMHPITLDIKPLQWPMDEVQVLAALCFVGRSGNAAFNPVATKLTKANLDLNCAHEYLSNSLPMFVLGVRSTTAILCDKNILQHPHEPITQIVIWISMNTTTRPVFCILNLKREGSPLRSVEEYEVQYFTQENCRSLKDIIRNTNQYLQVFEHTIIQMCKAENVPLNLEITINDYADPKLGLANACGRENPYEAALLEYNLKMQKVSQQTKLASEDE